MHVVIEAKSWYFEDLDLTHDRPKLPSPCSPAVCYLPLLSAEATDRKSSQTSFIWRVTCLLEWMDACWGGK